MGRGRASLPASGRVGTPSKGASMSTRTVTGAGIGLRRPHFDALTRGEANPRWLEFVPENFVGRGGAWSKTLEACAERWSLIPHGVSVNFGGPDPLDRDYLAALEALLDRIDAPYYSDHLCYTAIDGVAFHDLLPLPWTEEAVEHAAARIRMVADMLERPVLVENITYYASMPGGTMSEAQFVTAVVERAECGLLLDLNNVYVNAVNHGFDAIECLESMPLHRVRQMHVAGFTVEDDGRLLDDHGRPPVPEVLELLRWVVQRIGPIPTLFEWDTSIPPLGDVLAVAEHIDDILRDRGEVRLDRLGTGARA